ncbi:uncharacterized protein TRUGW13939_09549 [Talaromyces rugulosus]|uniref:Uncharacterized protein n=1 Tax=Talaromyces rugulosus TaxID=121627 RepID=A0A7H8R7N0_TALRU|nr:uncharacterized protein TRUGW13939_09549 [Talaromyces rugulosus]QKX62390.1 hypothetical protein TRUGW13939_09549 [Talaromyces rugulosus]
MVVTLYPHQNKPIPQWPFQISINTLLSIYGFVLKLAIPVVVASCLGQLQWSWFVRERPLLDLVRYNSAANGALGSLQWLWSNHIREPLTAFGAIITIFSIVIDPFIQQLVLYEDCSTITNSTASIPRTNHFESSGAHSGPLEETIEPGVQNAINLGLFGSQETITPNCPTGNCTFPPQYASLGYCSACQDISDQINVTFAFINHSYTQNTDPNLFISTSPSGLSTIWDNYGNDDSRQILFAGAAVQNGTQWMRSSRRKQHFVAMPSCECCQLQFRALCPRIDSSSLYLHQDESGSAPRYGLVDTQCISDHQKANLTQLGYEVTGRWLGYNITFDSVALDEIIPSNDTDVPFPESLYTRQCVYAINYEFPGSLWGDYLWKLFTGNLTGELLDATMIGEVNGPQSLKTLYNNSFTDFQSIDSAVQNMAESLTNYMRLTGHVN